MDKEKLIDLITEYGSAKFDFGCAVSVGKDHSAFAEKAVKIFIEISKIVDENS